ncbi:MMPL family transporter [Nocardioides sp. T2.26MG-1]|uniref:MMPL family transporter n=1 Tax=Nocardioides sp. T2.26MG-1 TaxID=3041166 RepID=UPI00247736C7|nr:MMPL family transporter [Nocardioides sp. T2.26MG-1]CAI9419516.1 Heme uptake protein MmpL11 [Nocardioides sp. T2.26MG-1]
MGNPLTAAPMKAARWSAEHPWRAILGWIAFVAVAVGCAVAIPTHETTDADYRIGESGRADAMVTDAHLTQPDTENILITARSGALDADQADRAAAELVSGARTADGVTRVAEPQWDQDHTALLVSVELAAGADDADAVQAVTDDVQASYSGLQVREAGDLTIDAAINDRVADDLGSAETISLPITLLLMALAFGALIAAGIPVLLAASSVAATIGLLAPLSHLVPAELTVSSMIVLIGMAVGVDYSLFYLKREREERANGRTTLDAVEIAARTSGHSILVSGGAVIASMAGLFVVGDATFNSLAIGSILVVAVAVLGSITVLPALLVKLGRFVDRPRVPLLWRLNRRIGRGGISSRLLRPVVRHPAIALVLSGVVVLGLAVPALGMKTHSGTLDTLPASIPQVQTVKDISKVFPADEGASANVVVKADAASQGDVEEALRDLTDRAVATGHFVASGRGVQTSADGTTSMVVLGMPYVETDDRVNGAVRELRDELVPAALGDVDGEHAVGGWAAEDLDFADHQDGRLLLVIGFVLLLTMLIMVTTFRSVALAIVSTILNLASVGAAFGVLTLVFQHGWGSGALDFTTPGFVIDWLPLFVLVVLVGLSMDYHVFVLSRIREHVDRGLPTRLAVERGIADTAGVVTSAAAVMVSVFAIFATLSMVEMKMMGVGLSASILLDATLIRLVMLPAILVLLGERAWWPRRPQRPRGVEISEPDPAYALSGR